MRSYSYIWWSWGDSKNSKQFLIALSSLYYFESKPLQNGNITNGTYELILNNPRILVGGSLDWGTRALWLGLKWLHSSTPCKQFAAISRAEPHGADWRPTSKKSTLTIGTLNIIEQSRGSFHWFILSTLPTYPLVQKAIRKKEQTFDVHSTQPRTISRVLLIMSPINHAVRLKIQRAISKNRKLYMRAFNNLEQSLGSFLWFLRPHYRACFETITAISERVKPLLRALNLLVNGFCSAFVSVSPTVYHLDNKVL